MIEAKVTELASVVLSIPEADWPAWHESVTRFAREEYNAGRGTYDRRKLAGILIQAMAVCYREWPPQES
jgi:hypothetical protein